MVSEREQLEQRGECDSDTGGQYKNPLIIAKICFGRMGKKNSYADFVGEGMELRVICHKDWIMAGFKLQRIQS